MTSTLCPNCGVQLRVKSCALNGLVCICPTAGESWFVERETGRVQRAA